MLTGELAVKLAITARTQAPPELWHPTGCNPDSEGMRKRLCHCNPGIRLSDKVEGNDQKRVLTPREAVAMGADYIVVGRPIRLADDPAVAADMITEEISEGLAH